MDTKRIKQGVFAAVALIVAGGAGYLYARDVFDAPIVRIAHSGCGIPASASFGVPLATAAKAAPTMQMRYGPLDIPGAGGLINLSFDPKVDGNNREVTLATDTLHLPVTFGRKPVNPERITVTCRNGDIATVRYQVGRSNNTTYQVVRMEAAAPETEPAVN